MKKLLLGICMLLTCSVMTASAQTEQKTYKSNTTNELTSPASVDIVYPMRSVLIADNTFMTDVSPQTVRITCTNEEIASQLILTYEPYFLRYAVNYKQDRMGTYREYTLWISSSQKNNILKTFNWKPGNLNDPLPPNTPLKPVTKTNL